MSAGDQLVDAIAEAVIQKIERVQTTPKARLMIRERAAEYLGVSEKTIDRMVVDKKLVPVRGVDSRTRFDVYDLDRLIENGKIDPNL